MTESVAEAAPGRAEVWRRALVTLGLLGVAAALGRVPLPFTPELALGLGRVVSIGALGLGPVIAAFVVVELVALAVPRLRARRHGSDAERAGITRSAWALAVVFTSIQAYGMIQALRYAQPGLFGYPVLEWGRLERALAALTLCAGTAVLCLLAKAISRRGLGNGLAVLMGADLLGRAAVAIARNVSALMPLAIPLVLLASAVTLVVRALVRAREGAQGRPRVPVPTCGLVPLPLASSLALAPAVLAYWLDAAFPGAGRWATETAAVHSQWIVLVVATGLAVLLSWTFTHGDRVEASWRAVDPAGAEAVRDAHRRARRRSLVLVPAMAAVPLAFSTLQVSVVVGVNGLYALALLATTLADVLAEARARARLGPLVPAFGFQRVYAAEPALVALAAAGIPAFARARHFRAVEQFFAPYAPVEFLVPTAHADEAAAICAPIAWPEGAAAAVADGPVAQGEP